MLEGKGEEAAGNGRLAQVDPVEMETRQAMCNFQPEPLCLACSSDAYDDRPVDSVRKRQPFTYIGLVFRSRRRT